MLQSTLYPFSLVNYIPHENLDKIIIIVGHLELGQKSKSEIICTDLIRDEEEIINKAFSVEF